MIRWWRNISVAKKLYSVVGLMAFLIAAELATLKFAMDTLSSVRSFVGGEGLWSKAQKSAVHSLQNYALTGDANYFREYQEHLKIPLGDRQARLELSKPDGDLNKIREGFAQGGNHEKDIPGLITLIQRFHSVSYIKQAIVIWTEADKMLDELLGLGNELDLILRARSRNAMEYQNALRKISELDKRLTVLENEFSSVLGEGSRWLEALLMAILLALVCTVEATGLILTFSFGKNLSRDLQEIHHAALEVGKGNFDQKLPVRSKDEIGMLAAVINKMSFDLKNSIGQRKQAEAANQIKTIFLANMSHEIRTPLGVILGLTEILKTGKITNEERRQYLDIIDRTGHSLSQIINDILDISRVEAGHIDVDKTMFSLSDLLVEIHNMLSIHANAKDNKVIFTARGTLPDKIATDRARLRQILVNLLNNAVKFTRRGEINMVYWASSNSVYFEISDNGIGMTEDQRQNLFGLFYQGDSSSTRKYEGTGLGLALSKRLAKALGGDIDLVDSKEEKGSTFLLSIPVDRSVTLEEALDEKIEIPDGVFSDKKILVVEDNKDNQLLIDLYLKETGAVLHFASNGEEGYQKIKSEKYDMILLDIQMPLMDGYALVKCIREEGVETPVIAVTAHAMKGERAKCLNAGCTDYLAKPVSSSSLNSLLTKYI